MMMAHDSGPSNPGSIDPQIVERVRDALDRYLADPAQRVDTLRAALHELAAAARTSRMPPEQLLVLLKFTWYALPAVRDAKSPAEQTTLLQRAVSICIGEYFAE